MMKQLITLFLMVSSLALWAQDTSAVDDFFSDVDEQYDNEKKEEARQEVETMDAVMEMTEELIMKQNDYAVYSLEHRKKVFNWQLIAGKIIFVFVMLIVLSGLALSYMHFYQGLKSGQETPGTELEMSTSGVKINSSVIGLVILVLAIAFLYLYLVHVFPINEFNVDSTYLPE